MSDLFDQDAVDAETAADDAYETHLATLPNGSGHWSDSYTEPPLDDEELAEVVRIGARCLCGRRYNFNPFGGKVKCPNCGAEVGPL